MIRPLSLLCMVAALTACSPPRPSINYEDGAFTAHGWIGLEPPPGGWPEVFAVRAGADPDAPPMLGSYSRHGSTVTFTPRFPPSPAVDLHVTFQPRIDLDPIRADFPGKQEVVAPETRVETIWPAGETWPANTLRMYVTFTKPMARGEAWTHLRVRDAQGQIIEKPFVETDPELWDPEGRRLTVLFDPGRLKRGLIDNEKSGPPLVAGRKVTIEVDPTWRDARGAPLEIGYQKTLHVTAEVRDTIDLKTWKLEPPSSPTSDLVVRFPRPLDHALALRAISVTRSGDSVAGDLSLDANDTTLRFKSSAPWSSGSYTLSVDGILEDVAGNRMGKLFDVDTSDPKESTVATKHGELAFVVR